MKVKPLEGMLAMEQTKKLGRSSQFGCYVFGSMLVGVDSEFYGIFQRGRKGHNQTGIIPGAPRTVHYYVKRDYSPTNPQTELQQSRRTKFAEAVETWQGLTNEQKANYNARSAGKHMTGYNLFISEYMNSE